MSIKPIQSRKDLIEYLSLQYDPVNLNIVKVNDKLKATLIMPKSIRILTFKMLKGKIKEVSSL